MVAEAEGDKPHDDMSTKIGGRTVTPALPVVDASPPTTLETTFDESLKIFITDNVTLEATEGIQCRERVLNRMGVLCRDWIKRVCEKRNLPPDVVSSAGGQLFTSGSYRLGVHEPGADIDTILVAPNVCTKQDFFGTMPSSEEGAEIVRDPDSLAERIRRHPDVTNFVPVEGAAVPILTFDWEGVNIDLLFARLNSASVPADFDIDNDAVLDGVDSATEKSLNGPRVTNLIAALVSGTPERYQTFLTVVRCVRKWAKARGLYSNKMGYWGGVNINIGVALCVQLYPNTTPASLLRKFFLVFRTWRWPNPVMLTKPHDAGYGLLVWSPQAHNARQVAPVITPAYPAMNSTLAVSRQTLQIMHEEFCRGHEILDRLWKTHQQNQKQQQSQDSSFLLQWDELFRPSDFFIAYPYYLSLCIVGPTQNDAQAWVGFVESRLRKLVSDMLGRSLPLSKIQLWPKKLEACIADRTALLTMAQRKNSVTYMVGFQVDTLRMRGRQLNVELQMAHFREWELARFQPLIPGMDVLVKAFAVKNLPMVCFEIYEGGKEVAMQRRRRLRDADPKRQERKRIKKLNELKAKMAEIQKRKEQKEEDDEGGDGNEEQGDDENRKRKRSDADPDDDDGDDAKAMKTEDDDQDEDETAKAMKTEDDQEDDDEAAKAMKTEDDGDDDDVVVMKTEDDGDDDDDVVVKAEVDDDVDNEDDEDDEAKLLESALDTLQDAEAGEKKTREEAEADRQKLLAGELLVEGEGADVPSDDEEAMGYGDVTAFLVKPKVVLPPGGAQQQPPLLDDTTTAATTGAPKPRKDIRSLPLAEEEAEILRKAGYTIVSDADEETKVIGGNLQIIKTSQEQEAQLPTKLKIKFLTKFDIVELDPSGHVIDKGNEDFSPSETWIGRKAGFEFKLGERGLGYYRTGTKVVVPSNTAY